MKLRVVAISILFLGSLVACQDKQAIQAKQDAERAIQQANELAAQAAKEAQTAMNEANEQVQAGMENIKARLGESAEIVQEGADAALKSGEQMANDIEKLAAEQAGNAAAAANPNTNIETEKAANNP